jgi:hypothetical protein
VTSALKIAAAPLNESAWMEQQYRRARGRSWLADEGGIRRRRVAKNEDSREDSADDHQNGE